MRSINITCRGLFGIVLTLAFAWMCFFAFPNMAAMCESDSREVCLEGLSFSEGLSFGMILLCTIYFVPSYLISTLLWKEWSWSSGLAMPIVAGGIVSLEYFSGAVQNLDIWVASQFGLSGGLLVYLVLVILPFAIALVVRSVEKLDILK